MLHLKNFEEVLGNSYCCCRVIVFAFQEPINKDLFVTGKDSLPGRTVILGEKGTLEAVPPETPLRLFPLPCPRLYPQ